MLAKVHQLVDRIPDRIENKIPKRIRVPVGRFLREQSISATTETNIEHPEASFKILAHPVGKNNWQDYPEHGCHEPIVTRRLADRLDELDNPVFWDIGSHRGYYGVLACQFVDPSNVHLFEGDDEFAELVAENNSMYADGQMHLNRKYVGSQESPGTTRLDTYLDDSDPPSIIKIDIDGAESDIFGGLAEVVDRHRPEILLEVHYRGDYNTRRDRIIEFFSARDYSAHICQNHRDMGAEWSEIDLTQLPDEPENEEQDYMMKLVPNIQ